jgi:hypothetical protein
MKMKHTSRNHVIAITLTAAFTMLPLSNPASAASMCSGLEIKACGVESSCSWINSYKTKKGKTINAYCRTKPGKKSSKTAPVTSKLPEADKNS